MKNIYNSIDILSSSSCGEGFPNVIGEAMACTIPCVVTDVGDSAVIVGNTGLVVPPKNPKALAEAIIKMIEMGEAKQRELGEKARDRIKKNFSIEKVVKRYEDLYREILEKQNNK